MPKVNVRDSFTLSHVHSYPAHLGRLYCVSGLAVRIRDQAGHSHFLNKKSLLKHALSTSQRNAKLLRRNRRVQQAFWRAVAPNGDWLGANEKELSNLLETLHSNGPDLTVDETIQQLIDLNAHQATEITRDDLEIGDIVFTRLGDEAHPTWQRRIICRIQKTMRFRNPRNIERHSYRVLHVSIYLGNRRFAEAVQDTHGGPELRTVTFEHPYFSRDQQDYLVTRIQDSDLAQRAATIAKRLTHSKESESDIRFYRRYSVKAAILSVFQGPWNPTRNSMLRTLRAQEDLRFGNDEKIIAESSFHCSYFVPYIYQLALMERYVEHMQENHKMSPPESKRSLKSFKRWFQATQNKLADEEELCLDPSKHPLFGIHPRKACPQDLRVFFAAMGDASSNENGVHSFVLAKGLI